MPDSDAVSLRCPGTWPRKLRLGLEATVTVMTNAYVMARSRAAGSPSKTVRLMAETAFGKLVSEATVDWDDPEGPE